ncbi:Retrovirus-related Pol polyprotein from transposon 17.6 [Vitis vinifera]|uniref:Retrovirus-related Pol polyprotein from transposon 17.6 n=1 Tax=Vitis vinifera TaxID=29760 RepID=A0A438DH90_VITVI|nr:Retrovirus-related Pol polyprotein from transposon 17.6 [Vitis vinifera]
MFGVSVLETDGDDSIPDAYTDDMDFIGIGRILDATPRGTHSAFDISGVSVLDDESVLDVVTSHLPFITPPAPTTHINDVDDVGDTDDPLDQPREIKIGSSLSPDERSRLIDLLRSYLDVFAWSYEDMSGLDPSIVKEEIRKQLIVGFLSVVEYPEWLANVVPIPKKDGKGIRCCPSWMAFLGINQILMAPEDMEKTSFITEWGTYCYRVMPFGLKNAGATYQRAATTLFHDMMHTDVEFRLRLNPKKCTFGVASGKLLGHIVSERGIEIDPEKIRAILDMPVPRTEKDIRGFLRQIAVHQSASHIRGRPLLLYLSVSDMALGCMLAQLDDLGKERAIYYLSKRMLEYECKYIMIERLCLALACSDRRLMRWLVLLTEFDIHYVTEIVSMTSITGWRLYFDGAANQSGFGIGILLISPQGDHIPRSVRWRSTGIPIGYTANSGAENQFADALATLASMIVIPTGVTVRPLLIETRSAPAYYCLIGEIEDQIEFHDRASADRVMREVHAGVCGPHMGGHMLAHLAQVSSGHEYLVAIDYFTKWVEAASYARLTAARGEVDTLIQEYGIQHHRSSAYRPQTNGAVEAANKNIKRILRKMVETSRDWSEKLPFALWAYLLPVEIEMRSLRVALEQHVSEASGPVSLRHLSLLDEKD